MVHQSVGKNPGDLDPGLEPLLVPAAAAPAARRGGAVCSHRCHGEAGKSGGFHLRKTVALKEFHMEFHQEKRR